MNALSLHLAPNAPWLLLTLASLAFVALAVWAYGFGRPPLKPGARGVLRALRAIALLIPAWLLAQPVLERAQPASGTRVLVLVDRSASMDLPAAPGGPTRAAVAARAARELEQSLRGRARVEVRGFAATLEGDSARAGDARDATALGDALGALAAEPFERRPDGVVVVSDGVVNAGADPVEAARALGVPVHGLLVGAPLAADRAVAEVEASPSARVGEATPVRVHVLSGEPRGTPVSIRLSEDGRELAHTSVSAPGPGAEAVAELRVTPARAGLAVWTAKVDPLAGDPAPLNDARGVALQVSPGRLGVLIVSAALNWDLAFLRRAWLGDSSLALQSYVRDRDGWHVLESRRGGAPDAAALHGKAVVVLDGVSGADVGAAFDAALAAFVRQGGGLLLLGGPAPGLARYAHGALAAELALTRGTGAETMLPPQPTAAASEVLAWDDDPARGEQAWRAAAPLAAVQPLLPGAGDRILLAAQGGGAPLLFSRRAGRGPVLLLNGSGIWRWSLSGTDAMAGARGRRLWRHVARWLAEPVQGEPLRVQPERWLAAAGEPVKLMATLQDGGFRPVADATLSGEASDGHGHARTLSFAPGAPGSYAATVEGLPAGRWQVTARAMKAGREIARARSEFAVDRWSLEALRADPDSSTLAAVARATRASVASATGAGAWARALTPRALAHARTTSTRLWESPWLFAVILGALAIEWGWRRRRGLP